MRDSQKSKVYKAENVIIPFARKFADITETRAFVDSVTMSSFYQRKWPKAPWSIRVKDGRGTRIARGGRGGINLPLWARNQAVCLHEIAHCITPHSCAHGWQFTLTFLQLVEHFMGRDVALCLKESFKLNRVRFRAPVKRAPLSPERRAELAARLAQYRTERMAAKPQ